MATLEKIRSKGGLLVTIIGLALAAFILGDLAQGVDGFNSRDTIGEVNGMEIKREEFNRELDRLTEAYKMQMQQEQLNDEMQEMVRQTTWDNMVRERILGTEYAAIGLGMSSKELFELMSGDNIHPVIQNIPLFTNPEVGGFDRELLLQFLSSLQLNSNDPAVIEQTAAARNYWLFWENFVRNARLEEKYNTLLSKAMSTNTLDAQFAIDAVKRTVDLTYAVQPYSSIADSLITVSDRELKAEYDRIKHRFEQTASRDAKYIVFSVEPTDDDRKIAEEFVAKHKEDFATTTDVAGLLLDVQSDAPFTGRAVAVSAVDPAFRDFATSGKNGDVSEILFSNNAFKAARIIDNNIFSPDSARVRHIVIAQETPERTKALADSLYKAISGGADFAALAGQFSAAPTAQNGGEVGWITETSLDDQRLVDGIFRGTAGLFTFDSPAGGNGTQIIQVQERTKPVRKINLAVLQRTVEASSLTSNMVYNNAMQFIAQHNTLAKFEQSATENSLDIRSSNATENDPRFAGFRDTRGAVRWLFESSAGDVSREVYQSDNVFIAVALSQINEEGVAPLANVEAELRQNIITDKKAEQISSELRQKLSANNSLAALGLPVDSLSNVNFTQPNLPVGYEPRLVGAASVSKVNAVSAPLRGERGVFVYQVNNELVNPGGNPVAFEKTMLNQMNARYTGRSFEALRKTADIVDKRANFF